MDLWSLLPTPSPATTAAREIVVRYSSAALVNHCDRSYLWSASLGELRRIPYDAELLYVASMLHDLGLVPAFDNHLAPFEDAGGDVGWVSARAPAGPPTDVIGSRRSSSDICGPRSILPKTRRATCFARARRSTSPAATWTGGRPTFARRCFVATHD